MCRSASPQATAVTPVLGGFGGGIPITITGRGFAPLATGATTVTVCGQLCAITSASYTSVTCVTPTIATPTSLAAFAHVAPVVLSGTVVGLGRSTAAYAAAFDGDIETTMLATCNSFGYVACGYVGIRKQGRVRCFLPSPAVNPALHVWSVTTALCGPSPGPSPSPPSLHSRPRSW
jgi:hypothetical protein